MYLLILRGKRLFNGLDGPIESLHTLERTRLWNWIHQEEVFDEKTATTEVWVPETTHFLKNHVPVTVGDVPNDKVLALLQMRHTVGSHEYEDRSTVAHPALSAVPFIHETDRLGVMRHRNNLARIGLRTLIGPQPVEKTLERLMLEIPEEHVFTAHRR